MNKIILSKDEKEEAYSFIKKVGYNKMPMFLFMVLLVLGMTMLSFGVVSDIDKTIPKIAVMVVGIVCLLGLVGFAYAFWVEIKLEVNDEIIEEEGFFHFEEVTRYFDSTSVTRRYYYFNWQNIQVPYYWHNLIPLDKKVKVRYGSFLTKSKKHFVLLEAGDFSIFKETSLKLNQHYDISTGYLSLFISIFSFFAILILFSNIWHLIFWILIFILSLFWQVKLFINRRKVKYFYNKN